MLVVAADATPSAAARRASDTGKLHVSRAIMKQRFTSLDVRAMVLSLQQTIIGYRVANAYDINARTYLLKLSKPDSKILLLLESGIRVHATAFARVRDFFF